MITFLDLQKITSLSQFCWRGRNNEIKLPYDMTQRQAEWEFYVSKLHGRDLAATNEDLEVLKNLVNKLA